jgi:ribosomal protein S18 acetylase RimI-like enzyme
MNLRPASEFDAAALTELFNAGFSDYLIPMRLSEAAFCDHVALYDIDLGLSRVVVDDGPVAFVLVGRRGDTGWIGGMGTTPSHRRRGLGEEALASAMRAAAASGCVEIGLEVLEGNEPAIRLYTELGFEIVRDLSVWSLSPTIGRTNASAETVDVGSAQRWIAAHRRSPEPWQRADETLVALKSRGAHLRGLVSKRGDKIVAAAVIHEAPEAVAVLQIAAPDEDSARTLLLAAGPSDRALRLSNVPIDEPASAAIELLGAEHVANQYEMALRILVDPRLEP